MLRPTRITFTGADDRTELKRMDAIARAFPAIEWGILFSPSNRDARYPSRQAVAEMLDVAGAKAAHLCGGFTRAPEMVSVFGGPPLSRFGRVQLNGKERPPVDPARVARDHGVEVILQTRDAVFPDDASCSWLFDASGGEGLFPAAVPPLRPGMRCGYAGGMGPETVLDYLRLIEAAGVAGDFWIDMESRVRTNGWFDLDKVERVCELVFGAR